MSTTGHFDRIAMNIKTNNANDALEKSQTLRTSSSTKLLTHEITFFAVLH